MLSALFPLVLLMASSFGAETCGDLAEKALTLLKVGTGAKGVTRRDYGNEIPGMRSEWGVTSGCAEFIRGDGVMPYMTARSMHDMNLQLIRDKRASGQVIDRSTYYADAVRARDFLIRNDKKADSLRSLNLPKAAGDFTQKTSGEAAAAKFESLYKALDKAIALRSKECADLGAKLNQVVIGDDRFKSATDFTRYERKALSPNESKLRVFSVPLLEKRWFRNAIFTAKSGGEAGEGRGLSVINIEGASVADANCKIAAGSRISCGEIGETASREDVDLDGESCMTAIKLNQLQGGALIDETRIQVRAIYRNVDVTRPPPIYPMSLRFGRLLPPDGTPRDPPELRNYLTCITRVCNTFGAAIPGMVPLPKTGRSGSASGAGSVPAQ